VFNFSGSEMIFLLIIALVILGPERLPDAVRRFGKAYGELRKMTTGFQTELKQALDEPMREMKQTTDALKKAATFDVDIPGVTKPKPTQNVAAEPTSPAPAVQPAAAPVAPAEPKKPIPFEAAPIVWEKTPPPVVEPVAVASEPASGSDGAASTTSSAKGRSVVRRAPSRGTLNGAGTPVGDGHVAGSPRPLAGNEPPLVPAAPEPTADGEASRP
jgi:sec-independent protein translocase protein TatB